MKNLCLFAILSVLLTVAYFLDKDKDEISSALFKKGSITKLVLPNISIDLNKTKNLDPQKVEKILNHLYSLKVVKKYKNIELDKRNILKFKVFINNEESTVSIHDLNPITGAFYISINSNQDILLIEDTFTFEGFYKDDQELFKKRFYSFLTQLKLSHDFFMIKKVFEELVINKLKIKSISNRSFELDFKKNQIIPKPPSPIKHISLDIVKNKFINLSYLSIQDKLENSQLVSTLVVDESKFFEIYRHNDQYYLKKHERFYLIRVEDLRYFIHSMQNLWLKKISLNVIEKIKQSDMIFTVKFANGDLSHFKLKSFDPFKYEEVDGREFNEQYINLLFNVVLNAKPFSEAKFILSDTDYICSGVQLIISDRPFCFMQKDQDLRVIDGENKLEYFYQDVLDKSIKLTKNNFLI